MDEDKPIIEKNEPINANNPIVGSSSVDGKAMSILTPIEKEIWLAVQRVFAKSKKKKMAFNPLRAKTFEELLNAPGSASENSFKLLLEKMNARDCISLKEESSMCLYIYQK